MGWSPFLQITCLMLWRVARAFRMVVRTREVAGFRWPDLRSGPPFHLCLQPLAHTHSLEANRMLEGKELLSLLPSGSGSACSGGLGRWSRSATTHCRGVGCTAQWSLSLHWPESDDYLFLLYSL